MRTTWYGKGVQECTPVDELAVPAVLAPLWPPSYKTLPTYVGLLVLALLLVVMALRQKQTASDQQFQERRMRQIMDQLAQVELENKENTEARAKWYERKMKIEEHAKKEAKAKGNADWQDLYKDAAIASGFAEQELPKARCGRHRP